MDRLRELLLKYEGLRLKPYTCTQGKLTIGVGRNLEDNGISKPEAMLMLSNDIVRVDKEAFGRLEWINSLSRVRQEVILLMLFQLGLPRLLEFKRLIAAIRVGNFDLAAEEMLNSKWSTQSGLRAVEMARMMRTNQYPTP
jgi:lysozyme